jgi:hypothetical protein
VTGLKASVPARDTVDPARDAVAVTLLQAFFSIHSERMLMEQINCNLLFCWCICLSMDADAWHPTGFTHNRDRLDLKCSVWKSAEFPRARRLAPPGS